MQELLYGQQRMFTALVDHIDMQHKRARKDERTAASVRPASGNSLPTSVDEVASRENSLVTL